MKDVSISHFGAHIGQEVDTYIELNFNNINLYEPQSIHYKALEKKYSEISNIYIFNKGLGNINEKKELIIDDNEGQSASLLNPTLHKTYFPNITFNKTEIVDVIKYDDTNNHSNFLVLDLQGYELEALKGSKERLDDSVKYIICEIFREELYEDSPTFKDIDEYLNKFGFTRADTVWSTGSLYKYGDGFYIKKTELNFLNRLKIYIKNIVNDSMTIFSLKILFLRIKYKFTKSSRS